ncbi:hypothetical protein HPB50_012754 [Hyalomma asiaticum]|uniref:Uncharacterized protein n=1 Tax=Hyalomma asiaticum TaxID=266040 RepID=A0ACB7T1H3_HYAAI|nr:hypothetical protein HPB50_012754 [Hyalomma asiaticum]
MRTTKKPPGHTDAEVHVPLLDAQVDYQGRVQRGVGVEEVAFWIMPHAGDDRTLHPLTFLWEDMAANGDKQSVYIFIGDRSSFAFERSSSPGRVDRSFTKISNLGQAGRRALLVIYNDS